MANEYAVNQADLISVADAIRAKGETTETLSFPDGFVSAIQDISTGAALNFQVVGGTAEPENPTENTIWVNTDQTITGWVFSHNQPDSPSEGMVWIINGVSGTHEFDAVADISLRVQAAGAKQYINGSWTLKSTQVYQDGAWTSLLLYLVRNGTDQTGITGGWKTGVGWGYDSYVYSPTITFSDNLMKVTYPSKPAIRGGISTENPIDLTNYNTLEALFAIAQASTGSYISGADVSLYLVASKNMFSRDVSAQIVYKATVRNKTVTIDISDLTGFYYIGLCAIFGANSNATLYAHIDKIELKR